MTEETQFPIIHHHGNQFSFEYPQGGQVVEIDHSDGSRVTRLIGLVGGKVVQIDIETWRQTQSAEKACQAIYDTVEKAYRQESVAPEKIDVGKEIGWRCIRRLVDGATALHFMDTIFTESPLGIVRIQMSADPEVYNQARPILEKVLRTIEFHGG